MDLLELLDGDVSVAVAAVASLGRAVWRSYLYDTSSISTEHSDRFVFDGEFLLAAFREECKSSPLLDPYRDANVEELQTALTGSFKWKGTSVSVPRKAFSIPETAQEFLSRAGYGRLPDLRYFALRDLRSRHRISWSSPCVRSLLYLARETVLELEKQHSPNILWLELATALEQAARELTGVSKPTWSDILLEHSAIQGIVKPFCARMVEFQRDRFSPESFISQIFGVPTSIRGFDDLFGGGLILLDTLPNQAVPPDRPAAPRPRKGRRMGGRTVLSIGPFGSGKSSLTLQMAVEVARKGGVAWVVALEQSPDECCIALETLGIPVPDRSFDLIVDNPDEAFDTLVAPAAGRGALIFDVSRSGDGDWTQFLERLQRKLEWLSQYPLRLIIIDPISAIFSTERDTHALKWRRETFAFFQKAKEAGVNVWMTSEQLHERSVEGRFEENIADTVVRLNVERNRPYQQRYIEVTKSRLQREKPGRHAFTLSGHPGIAIHPSSDTYIRAPFRGVRQTGSPVRMMIPGLDEIIGPNAVLSGDLVALHGPTGTSKTLFGLLFLRGFDLGGAKPGSASSLLISDLSVDRMNTMLDESFRQEIGGDSLKTIADIDIHSVQPGYRDAGEILRGIRDKLERLKDKQRPVDRAMISNLSRWELDMPLLKEDPTFGIALLSLLRSHGVTSAIVCGYSSEMSDSAIKNVLLESADCILEFSRLEFRGQERQFVRAVKTHQMTHRRGRFELVVGRQGVSITPKESLIRLDAAGNVKVVPIVLFLHAETPNHETYNNHLVSALKTTLSRSAGLSQQMRRYDTSVLTFGAESSVDELQILQLDEFQLPQARQRTGRLFDYHLSDKRCRLLDDRLDRLREPALVEKDRFVAVPFYENISFMAYDRRAFKKFPSDWRSLAGVCSKWELNHRDQNQFFFACPVAQSDRFESYNCLFFEILYSLQPPEAAAECDLYTWLFGPKSRAGEAVRYFCTLVRRFHKANFLIDQPSDTRSSDEKQFRQRQTQLSLSAVVWRHWYNTLNQMLSQMPSDRRSRIVVRALYGCGPKNTVTTAGEWYLAVPAYSAAPEVALEIIEFLTTPEKELQRAHLGIGLPTRKDFYNPAPSDKFRSATISPYFEFDLTELRGLVTERVFRRSSFSCYETFAELVSSHLVRILESPETDLDHHIDEAMHSLRLSFEFMRRRELCDSCRSKAARNGLTTLSPTPQARSQKLAKNPTPRH